MYSAARCTAASYVSYVMVIDSVIQIFSIFTDFFCLVGLIIAEIWVLKSPTIIMEFFFFNSVKFWFLYFQVLLLNACTFMTFVSS